MHPSALVIPVSVFKRLTPAEAVLLAYFVWWEAQGTVGEAKWFRCPQERIRDELGFPVSTQTRLINRLEDDHWCLETRKVGFPAKREIRLVPSMRPVKMLRRMLQIHPAA